MSEVDNFESLSNAELRAKCIQHGLPNVPVTDTSRKVLIKKLRASLSGSSPAAQKKSASNRRETIHVASKVYPSIDAVKAATGISGNDAPSSPGRSANRRTIAATQNFSINSKTAAAVEIPAKTAAPATVAAPITSSRRTVHKTVEENVPNIILDSDDEDDDMLIGVAKRVEEVNAKLTKVDTVDNVDTFVRPRTSRSVSLSKTGVLTTSYLQDVAPLPPVIADDEESDNSLADNVRNKPRSYEHRFTSNFGQTLGSRQPPVAASTTAPVSTLFTAPSSLYSSQQQPSRYTIGSTTTTSRLSTLPPSNYFSPSTVRNVTTTSGYNLQKTPITETSYYGEQSDDTDTNNEEPDEQGQFKTPYLSSFARTLERMKADPIGGSGASGNTLFSSGESEITRRYKTSKPTYQTPGRRPKIGADSGDVTMRDILLALDQKYHLKRNFIILLIILLFVFLFVLFWQ